MPVIYKWTLCVCKVTNSVFCCVLYYLLRCWETEWGSEFRSTDWSADSFLPASSQISISILTSPVRLLPRPYGTHADKVNVYEQKMIGITAVRVCVCFHLVSRAALRWHCSVSGRRWRRIHAAYVLFTRACSSTDSWRTHRLRYKLFVCCIQWVTYSTYVHMYILHSLALYICTYIYALMGKTAFYLLPLWLELCCINHEQWKDPKWVKWTIFYDKCRSLYTFL